MLHKRRETSCHTEDARHHVAQKVGGTMLHNMPDIMLHNRCETSCYTKDVRYVTQNMSDIMLYKRCETSCYTNHDASYSDNNLQNINLTILFPQHCFDWQRQTGLVQQMRVMFYKYQWLNVQNTKKYHLLIINYLLKIAASFNPNQTHPNNYRILFCFMKNKEYIKHILRCKLDEVLTIYSSDIVPL